MSKSDPDINRPYLVIPKLVKQPTWGGNYIVNIKGWSQRPGHDVKIGQAYELFSGSNLSLLDSSEDPNFEGELTDNVAVARQTNPANSIALSDLTEVNPEKVLGKKTVVERGPKIALLIKFTQALGNSFQVHIKDGVAHPTWLPKPESWYYFEPGLLTLGIKAEADWSEYEKAVRQVHAGMTEISEQIHAGELDLSGAKLKVDELLQKYDPWQFVNTVTVERDQIVDLSEGGLHHSWEEDSKKAPLGNVLLELQAEAMDDISTFRSFDKGKIGDDGSIRDVHIDTYFEVIDRSLEANDPSNHIYDFELLLEDTGYRLEKLMRSKHFNLDKLTLLDSNSSYTEGIDRYKHLFVKSGKIAVEAGDTKVTVGAGHSCFVPASVTQYTVQNLDATSEILLSY